MLERYDVRTRELLALYKSAVREVVGEGRKKQQQEQQPPLDLGPWAPRADACGHRRSEWAAKASRDSHKG